MKNNISVTHRLGMEEKQKSVKVEHYMYCQVVIP